MQKSLEAKNRMLNVSARVFYQHGYRATAVETIAKAVGVTKPTLYHHFDNKDDLILSSLRHLSERIQASYVKTWTKKGLNPLEKLTVLFDEMHKDFQRPNFYGCPFINAASEYADRSHPVRIICSEHFAFLTKNLEQFAKEAHLIKPKHVAEKLVGCITGAYSTWLVCGLKDAALQAKHTAGLIIAKHTR